MFFKKINSRCKVANPNYNDSETTKWLPLENKILEYSGYQLNVLTQNQSFQY